jgi:hypothetical protein
MLGHGGCLERQGKHFVVLALGKFDRDLNASQIVLTREIHRALRVLEIVSFKGIHGPVPQAAQVKLRARVLKQNSHRTPVTTLGFWLAQQPRHLVKHSIIVRTWATFTITGDNPKAR